MNSLPLEETADCACRTLSHFIKKEEFSAKEIRKLILRDLCWRIPNVQLNERAIILAEAFIDFLPKDLKSTFPGDHFGLKELSELRKQESIEGTSKNLTPRSKDAQKGLFLETPKAEKTIFRGALEFYTDVATVSSLNSPIEATNTPNQLTDPGIPELHDESSNISQFVKKHQKFSRVLTYINFIPNFIGLTITELTIKNVVSMQTRLFVGYTTTVFLIVLIVSIIFWRQELIHLIYFWFYLKK